MPSSILGLFKPDPQRDLPAAILRSIAESDAWCSRRQASSNLLRSPELDPSAILSLPDFPDELESIKTWVEKKRDSYHRAVSWITLRRSELLTEAGVAPSDPIDTIARSKLLRYEPLETVSDGAAEAASRGFYDMEDAPPWDTWFWYADNAVFCCVPESVFPSAQAGIDANPVDCIQWADWSALARINR